MTNNTDFDVPAELRRDLMAAALAKQLSYAWLCDIYRQGVYAGRATTIGPTGAFPYGDLGPDDEGELAVAIAADPRHGVVRFEFGKPVAWLALPPAHARQLAALLLENATTVEKARS